PLALSERHPRLYTRPKPDHEVRHLVTGSDYRIGRCWPIPTDSYRLLQPARREEQAGKGSIACRPLRPNPSVRRAIAQFPRTVDDARTQAIASPAGAVPVRTPATSG